MAEHVKTLGCRVLIVEDEIMISMMMEEMLEELGYETVGPATNINDALSLLESTPFDAAILDVNLNGKESYCVAAKLKQCGIPFIFATGYGGASLPEEYRDQSVLPKPFQLEDIERAVLGIVQKARQ